MNYLRNEVRNYIVLYRKLQIVSIVGKERLVQVEVVRDVKFELVVKGDKDERKNSKNLYLSCFKIRLGKN